jgi:hypothetical protein
MRTRTHLLFAGWPVAGAVRFLIILSPSDPTDKYERYCQDFGPTNIALVIRFCRCAPHLLPCTRSASTLPPSVVCCVTCISRCTLKFQTPSGVAWGGVHCDVALVPFALAVRHAVAWRAPKSLRPSSARPSRPLFNTAASDDCFLGTRILHCRREIHAKLQDPRLKDRPVVFYCQTGDNIFTNSILMLAAYLLLVKGYTVERALLPFAIIHRLPILSYLDATWYDAHLPMILMPDIRASAKPNHLVTQPGSSRPSRYTSSGAFGGWPAPSNSVGSMRTRMTSTTTAGSTIPISSAQTASTTSLSHSPAP